MRTRAPRLFGLLFGLMVALAIGCGHVSRPVAVQTTLVASAATGHPAGHHACAGVACCGLAACFSCLPAPDGTQHAAPACQAEAVPWPGDQPARAGEEPGPPLEPPIG